MKMNGQILLSGEIQIGKESYLLESGQNWMYGYIHYGKVLKLIQSIEKVIRGLGAV